MNKKIIALCTSMLCISMLFTACGSDSDKNTTGGGNAAGSTTTAARSTTGEDDLSLQRGEVTDDGTTGGIDMSMSMSGRGSML